MKAFLIAGSCKLLLGILRCRTSLVELVYRRQLGFLLSILSKSRRGRGTPGGEKMVYHRIRHQASQG